MRKQKFLIKLLFNKVLICKYRMQFRQPCLKFLAEILNFFFSKPQKSCKLIVFPQAKFLKLFFGTCRMQFWTCRKCSVNLWKVFALKPEKVFAQNPKKLFLKAEKNIAQRPKNVIHFDFFKKLFLPTCSTGLVECSSDDSADCFSHKVRCF